MERLRQYEPLKGGTPLPEFLLRQERDRLRAALAGLKDLTCGECVPCKRINAEIDRALSGEPSPSETGSEPVEFFSTKRMLAELIADMQKIVDNRPMSAGTRTLLAKLIAEQTAVLAGATQRAAEKASESAEQHRFQHTPRVTS